VIFFSKGRREKEVCATTSRLRQRKGASVLQGKGTSSSSSRTRESNFLYPSRMWKTGPKVEFEKKGERGILNPTHRRRKGRERRRSDVAAVSHRLSLPRKRKGGPDLLACPLLEPDKDKPYRERGASRISFSSRFGEKKRRGGLRLFEYSSSPQKQDSAFGEKKVIAVALPRLASRKREKRETVPPFLHIWEHEAIRMPRRREGSEIAPVGFTSL